MTLAESLSRTGYPSLSAPTAPGDGGPAGLGGPLHALGGEPDAGQFPEHARGAGERPGCRGQVVHRGQSGRHRPAGDAELCVPRRESVPALRAVIPGPGHGDQAERRVEGLVPVAGEHGLVAAPARDARPPVAAVSGQDLAQHGPAQPQQPGADHPLGCLKARVAAAQDPGGLPGEPS